MSGVPKKRARTDSARLEEFLDAAPREEVAAQPDTPRTFGERLHAYIATLGVQEAAQVGCVLESPFDFEDMVQWALEEMCENHEDEKDDETSLGITADALLSMKLCDVEMTLSDADFAPLRDLVAKLEAEKRRLADVFVARFFENGAAGRLQDTAA